MDASMIRVEQEPRIGIGGDYLIQGLMSAEREFQKLLVRFDRLLWTALLL